MEILLIVVLMLMLGGGALAIVDIYTTWCKIRACRRTRAKYMRLLEAKCAFVAKLRATGLEP